MKTGRMEDLLIGAFEWAINVSEQATHDLIRATGITSSELTTLGYDKVNFPKMHEWVKEDETMPKKYCLITVFERDIEDPKFFDTKEEAFESMRDDVMETLGLTREEFDEVYHDMSEDCITDIYAYGTNSEGDADWRIVEVEV